MPLIIWSFSRTGRWRNFGFFSFQERNSRERSSRSAWQARCELAGSTSAATDAVHASLHWNLPQTRHSRSCQTWIPFTLLAFDLRLLPKVITAQDLRKQLNAGKINITYLVYGGHSSTQWLSRRQFGGCFGEAITFHHFKKEDSALQYLLWHKSADFTKLRAIHDYIKASDSSRAIALLQIKDIWFQRSVQRILTKCLGQNKKLMFNSTLM